jgi:hypothetical protein
VSNSPACSGRARVCLITHSVRLCSSMDSSQACRLTSIVMHPGTCLYMLSAALAAGMVLTISALASSAHQLRELVDDVVADDAGGVRPCSEAL